MRCSRHDYTYELGVGVCPHCEQERHNREMEKAASEAKERQEKEAFEASLRREEREQAARERQDQRQKARNSDQIQDFIAQVYDTYGETFVSQHYLRLILAARGLTNSDVAAALINDVYARNFSGESRELLRLQKDLLEQINQERKVLERGIRKGLKPRKKSPAEASTCFSGY